MNNLYFELHEINARKKVIHSLLSNNDTITNLENAVNYLNVTYSNKFIMYGISLCYIKLFNIHDLNKGLINMNSIIINSLSETNEIFNFENIVKGISDIDTLFEVSSFEVCQKKIFEILEAKEKSVYDFKVKIFQFNETIKNNSNESII